MWNKVLLASAAGLLAVVMISCDGVSNDDTGAGITSAGDGSLSDPAFGAVTVSLHTGPSSAPVAGMASAPVAPPEQINVTFNSLEIWNSRQAGEPVSLIEQPMTVDLMAFFENPGELLGGVPIPDGTYNCLGGEIVSVELIDADQNSCAVAAASPNPFEQGICLGVDFLEVEGEARELLIELPVLGAQCAALPVVSLGEASLKIVR
ncbi:MAG: hypothetical protein JSV80_02715 [Acidobacteriota bacterium]|nr:MAG: hypothetical protein JSV80_02715 [Acidobacteriota bacterium]